MRKNIDILKWMFFLLLIVLGVGLVLPGSFGGSVANAAALVNSKPVSQQRYSRILNQQLEQARQAAGGELTEGESLKVRKAALNSLVEEELAAQHAADLGQTMTLAEFRDIALNDPSLKDEKGVFDPQRYQQILQQQADQGMSVADAEKGFQRGMLLAKIRGFWDTQAVLSPAEAKAAEAKYDRQVQAQAAVWDLKAVQAGLKLSDDKVRSYYARNKQRWVKPDEFTLRQILIRPDFGASTATAKAKADAVLAKLKAGASFEALAKTENSDPEARKNGGKLGTLRREDLRQPDLRVELTYMKVGGISHVVQTDEGFHILKLEAKKEGFEPTLENSRAKAADDLGKEEAVREAGKLASQALSDIKAGKTLSEAAKAHGAKVVNSGWFDRDSENALPSLGKTNRFARQMLDLNVGQASPQPVGSDQAVAIGVLTAERPGQAPAKKEAAAQRDQAALESAEQAKSQALYQAWVDGLKKDAVIKDLSGVLASK